LSAQDRRTIGVDIATIEYLWPVGMPHCRSLGGGLWEARSNISDGRIARVMFAAVGGRMVLLHGFVKKTQKTPDKDRRLAARRKKEIE
jgi:phage-related protein